ncbi:hypothetical protein HBI55_105340 [Parastagonospora nodorum]|nr:hypothetical protein HBI65_095760 [Parastagonospora nodorum]KAH6495214.1 hypothetical protein HBI55_105340 [Parastagonospora nodorum]
MQKPYPEFASLPVDKNGPRGNAWGLWGPDDQLGTLNHLTAERVRAAAAEEIRTGERVSLNWCLEGASNPRFQYPRKNLEVKLMNKEPRVGHSIHNVAVNGMAADTMHTKKKVYTTWAAKRKTSPPQKSPTASTVHMSQSGIAARAFFLDWYAWATTTQNLTIDTTTSHAIPFSDLHATATHQGISLSSMRPGDILIIRSGYLAQYANMPASKRASLDTLYTTTKPCNIGVEASPELLAFLWDKQIAAVAGDSRSFEAWPVSEERKEWHLHQWLLAGWGMPIGELWDLERLSEVCGRLARWSFFLTSAPMNVPGGVASPPNALAFF